MESKKNKLTKRDYFRTSLRSYILQNGFNYNTYQGVSYLNVILPGLKKIYKDDPEKLKETAKANLEFYNTSPHLVPFISNLQLAMYEDGQSIDSVRSIKMALMGPLAGIGDSIAQFGLAPLFSTIFAGLALDGLGFAPMGYWFAMLLSMLAIKVFMGYLGYRFATTVSSGEEQVVSIQKILDKMMPRLLPVLITVLVYYLLKKKKWNTYQLLILLFVIGILASVLGILA